MAFKMLIGNRSACIGVIFGIFLATLLIAQQSAIFLGLVARSYRVVTDISLPTIWVMDPATESEDKLRNLPLSYLDVVRGTQGVEWGVPFSSSSLPIVSPSGKFDICTLYGIDEATLIGAPKEMIEGSIHDLRRPGGVIVDVFSANKSLAKLGPSGRVPLTVGDTLEINNMQAVCVGICEITQNFYPQPIVFTGFSQAQKFNPGLVNRTSFVLVKTAPEADIQEVADRINSNRGLLALTRDQFKDRIRNFFLKTGILINFGLSVLLGTIIGFAIAGQIFYLMTIDNETYYALIKAIGGTKKMILQMILFQALVVGVIGYILGIAVTVLWGMAMQHTTITFLFPWQLLVFTAAIILLICAFTAAISIRRVLHTDPKLLMGT